MQIVTCMYVGGDGRIRIGRKKREFITTMELGTKCRSKLSLSDVQSVTDTTQYIPIDLSTRSFIPLPRFLRCRPTPFSPLPSSFSLHALSQQHILRSRGTLPGASPRGSMGSMYIFFPLLFIFFFFSFLSLFFFPIRICRVQHDGHACFVELQVT